MSKKTTLVCLICGHEIPNTKTWRRDVQAHYKPTHKTDKKYISAVAIKDNYFKIVPVEEFHRIPVNGGSARVSKNASPETIQAIHELVDAAHKTDLSKIENQIGCGYCVHEKTCIIRDPKINKAKLGCKDWSHWQSQNGG